MELSQLRYFVAVAEAESISRAASTLRIAQPAVSRQIRNLESNLGQRLFRRTDRGVTLTDAGREYLDQVRYVLRLLDQANESVRSGGVGQKILHVGIDQLAQFYTLVRDIFEEYRQANPGVRYEWLHLPSIEQENALIDGTIDIAVGVPMLGLRPELDQVRLLTLERGVIFSDRHALAGRMEMTPADLIPYPAVTTSRSTWFANDQGWFEGGRAWGFEPDFCETFDNVSLLLARLHDHQTIAFYPRPGALAPMSGLQFRTVPHLELEIPVSVYWRQEPERPLIGAFVRLVRNRMREGALA